MTRRRRRRRDRPETHSLLADFTNTGQRLWTVDGAWSPCDLNVCARGGALLRANQTLVLGYVNAARTVVECRTLSRMQDWLVVGDGTRLP
jgi:hypothetical protein